MEEEVRFSEQQIKYMMEKCKMSDRNEAFERFVSCMVEEGLSVEPENIKRTLMRMMERDLEDLNANI